MGMVDHCFGSGGMNLGWVISLDVPLSLCESFFA